MSAGKARLLEQYDKREAEVREAMQAAARASVELERATRYDTTRTSMDDIWICICVCALHRSVYFAHRVISSLILPLSVCDVM